MCHRFGWTKTFLIRYSSIYRTSHGNRTQSKVVFPVIRRLTSWLHAPQDNPTGSFACFEEAVYIVLQGLLHLTKGFGCQEHKGLISEAGKQCLGTVSVPRPWGCLEGLLQRYPRGPDCTVRIITYQIGIMAHAAYAYPFFLGLRICNFLDWGSVKR